MGVEVIIIVVWVTSMTGYGVYKALSGTAKNKLQYRSIRYLAVQDKRSNKRLNEEVK